MLNGQREHLGVSGDGRGTCSWYFILDVSVSGSVSDFLF